MNLSNLSHLSQCICICSFICIHIYIHIHPSIAMNKFVSLMISDSLQFINLSDLLYPSQSDERRKHKLKRLIQAPNSFFMDVKCPGCFHITTIFSHAQVGITFQSIYVIDGERSSVFFVYYPHFL
jgi:small subunit ribosomal protein S27e